MRNNELVFCECDVRYKLHIEKYKDIDRNYKL